MPARKFTSDQVQEIAQALTQYITDTDDPVLVGFLSTSEIAIRYWVNKDDLTRYKALRPLAERAHTKSEAYMLKKGMNGQSTAMSIFRLKQKVYGYSDRFEQDFTTKGEKFTFINDVPRPQDKKKR
jgi:hypothetical protein